MKIPKGKCNYCLEEISGRSMTKHLASCKEKKNSNDQEKGGEEIFLMKAKAGPFWVYFDANSSSTLKDVDGFLRDLWLECCGHLSLFKINNIRYAYDPMPEFGDESMDIQLKEVLNEGIKFSHEYDFGTTTYLELECISKRNGGKLKDIEIIGKNNMPDLRCVCGKSAKEICSECLWEKGLKAMLCEDCAKKHECDEEFLLPVVNSPRFGVCSYTGE